MFNIDPKKVGSLNEGGRNLKIGTFAYRITSADYAAKKSDPTGKEKQIIIGLQYITDPSYECKLYLATGSSNEATANIAQKTLVAIAAAAGIEGVLKPASLPKFLKKIVVIEASETEGKGANKGKKYVNVRSVEEYDPDAEEDETEDEESEEEEETPAPKKKVKAPVEEEEDDSDEDEDEEPAPVKKKKAPAPVEDEDDEDESEEEEPAPKKSPKSRPW